MSGLVRRAWEFGIIKDYQRFTKNVSGAVVCLAICYLTGSKLWSSCALEEVVTWFVDSHLHVPPSRLGHELGPNLGELSHFVDGQSGLYHHGTAKVDHVMHKVNFCLAQRQSVRNSAAQCKHLAFSFNPESTVGESWTYTRIPAYSHIGIKLPSSICSAGGVAIRIQQGEQRCQKQVVWTTACLKFFKRPTVARNRAMKKGSSRTWRLWS